MTILSVFCFIGAQTPKKKQHKTHMYVYKNNIKSNKMLYVIVGKFLLNRKNVHQKKKKKKQETKNNKLNLNVKTNRLQM